MNSSRVALESNESRSRPSRDAWDSQKCGRFDFTFVVGRKNGMLTEGENLKRTQMDKLEQFYRLHQIFEARSQPISVRDLAERLELSERTVRRRIGEFQTLWYAPLKNDYRRGWMYDPEERDRWEVPGLWMTMEESQSLMLMLDILNRFGNGLLNDELKVVRRSIDKSLTKRGISRAELEERVRIIPIGHRYVPDHRLHQVLNAFLKGTRLHIQYRDYQLRVSKRTVSPQRLVYYRDNWYMDAWCHTSNGLRTFSLARIQRGELTEEPADLIAQEELDAEFMGSYGVFAGKPVDTAHLRFLPEVAAEVSCQQWHPDQQGDWDGDDYLLRVPYADPRELTLDIMRHLPNVIVEAPESLKDIVRERIKKSMQQYEITG